ncbi:MAG: hypothetical protein AAGF24_11490 [Cyanobacteria bacterium P01_H01_bin.121]
MKKARLNYETLPEMGVWNVPSDRYNRAANWALCGFETRGVRLYKQDQLTLLGGYFGRGLIAIEYLERYGWVIVNIVTAAFGLDSCYEGIYSLETLERLQ